MVMALLALHVPQPHQGHSSPQGDAMNLSATASRSRYNLCDRVHGCLAFASQGIVIRPMISSGQRCLCCWSLRRKHRALTSNCRCQRYRHRFTASIMRMVRPCMHPDTMCIDGRSALSMAASTLPCRCPAPRVRRVLDGYSIAPLRSLGRSQRCIARS